MENMSPFCTCRDTACPMHPSNHGKGCAPCVAKNLSLGEIPSCFFNRADPDGERSSFFFEDFAEAVLKKKQSRGEK